MDNETRRILNEATNGADLASFIDRYRKAYDAQFEADKANLANQRALDHTALMSAANMRGTLHSSFPAFAKLKYDTQTYEPALTKLGTSYVTGLDTVYNNVAKFYNRVKRYQKDISSLN